MIDEKMTLPITLVFSNSSNEGITGSLGPDTKVYRLPDGHFIEEHEPTIHVYERNDLNGFLTHRFSGTLREVRQFINDLLLMEQVLQSGEIAKSKAPTSSLGDLF